MTYANKPVKGRRAGTHIQIGIALPADLTERLDAYVTRAGEPRSRVIAAALEKFLRKEERR